jgi:hypothetical protein
VNGIIIKEIGIKRASFSLVTFNHKRREGNKEAHSLPRYAVSLVEGRHASFSVPPTSVNIPVNILCLS